MRGIFRTILILFMLGAGTCTFASVGQSDSLLKRWQAIKDTAHDTAKIELLRELGRQIKYSNPDSAIQFLSIALDLAENNNLQNEKAHVISRMGGAKYVKGEYDFALEYFLEALSIWEEIDNKRGIAIGLNNIGLIQNMQEKTSKAIHNHLQSIELCKENKDTLLWAINVHNLGIAYNTAGSYDTAMAYADSSIKLYQSIGRALEAVIVNNLKGEIFINKGEYDKAIDNNLSIINHPDYNNKWEICYALANLADAEKQLGHHEKSIGYAMRSYKLALEIGAKWDIQKVTGILAEVYSLLKNWEEAYRFLTIHKAYSDSIFNEEKEKEINYLQLQRKHEENELLAAENQLHEQRIKRKNAVIYGVISGVLLLSLIVFVLYRNNFLKTRLNRELKKTSETIAEKNKKLTELNATKDRLFRIISHDLRSPVSNLVSFTDLLKENYNQFDEKTNSDIILSMNKTSKEGLRLLDNLLDWARSQTGTLALHPQNINPAEIGREVIELLMTSASAKNIKLDVAISEDLKVFADRNMLAAILRNLISNAIKYTPEGGNIKLEARPDASSSKVEITVSDNGIGIKKENLKTIFDLDEQRTTPGTNNEKGTGLGLIICKEFVEKQGGTIWVESEEGKGSKFTFTLPQGRAQYPESY